MKTKEEIQDQFVKETGICILDSGDYSEWLEEKLIWYMGERNRLEYGMHHAQNSFLTIERRMNELTYELEQTQKMLRQAEDAAGEYQNQCKEMETELRHIYDKPNINHP